MSPSSGHAFISRSVAPACSLFVAYVICALLMGPRLSAPNSMTHASVHWMYVGTASYTSQPSHKLYLCSFNSLTGHLQAHGVVANAVNPGFLAVLPRGPYLYAVNEIGNFHDDKSGAVSSFRIDSATGHLTLLNQVSSQGANPSFITLSANRKFAVVASYYGGVITLPIEPGGSLGEPRALMRETGRGVNRVRQESSHPHSVVLSPDNRFAISVDLGLDKLFVYRFNTTTGSLTRNNPAFGIAPPGAGPRHLAFAPSGRFAFVINELQSSLSTYAFDQNTGQLERLQTVSTLPSSFHGTNTGAEVEVAPSGRFVYASNRGHDSIAVFTVDPEKGTLTWVGEMSTEGKTPRHFVFDPSGNFLLVGNQDSNSIVVFRVDSRTGRLAPTGDKIILSSPVCIAFLP